MGARCRRRSPRRHRRPLRAGGRPVLRYGGAPPRSVRWRGRAGRGRSSESCVGLRYPDGAFSEGERENLTGWLGVCHRRAPRYAAGSGVHPHHMAGNAVGDPDGAAADGDVRRPPPDREGPPLYLVGARIDACQGPGGAARGPYRAFADGQSREAVDSGAAAGDLTRARIEAANVAVSRRDPDATFAGGHGERAGPHRDRPAAEAARRRIEAIDGSVGVVRGPDRAEAHCHRGGIGAHSGRGGRSGWGRARHGTYRAGRWKHGWRRAASAQRENEPGA